VVVDTLGLLLKVVVHPADLHDRLGAKLVLGALGTDLPRLQHIWADQGYAGALRQWTREQLGIELEVVYPWWRNLKRYFPGILDDMGFQLGFHVLPRRWVVERTFAWLGHSRRLSRDYERLPTSSEVLIYLTSMRLLLRRLSWDAAGSLLVRFQILDVQSKAPGLETGLTDSEGAFILAATVQTRSATCVVRLSGRAARIRIPRRFMPYRTARDCLVRAAADG
jgi:transposase